MEQAQSRAENNGAAQKDRIARLANPTLAAAYMDSSRRWARGKAREDVQEELNRLKAERAAGSAAVHGAQQS